ncbi:MAG: c-type cytochrome [Opitutales bacterium]
MSPGCGKWLFAFSLVGCIAVGRAQGADLRLLEEFPDGYSLIHELNCVACHEGKPQADLPPSGAPNLGETGSRLRPDWMRAFLLGAKGTNPGKTHPSLLAGISEAEAKERADALTHYLQMLTSTRVEKETLRGNSKAGVKTYREVGCAACHGSSDNLNAEVKYGNARGLADFLGNPRRLNPHGRMPSLSLTAQEALDLASALVKGGPPRSPENPKNDRPGVFYEVYKGNWDRLPNFDTLKPVKSGVIDHLAPSVTGMDDHFGVRHTGYLLIEKAGEYHFSTHSDDGSRFYLGHSLVVQNDGVHGGTKRRGALSLEPDKHAFTLQFFEKKGGHHNHVTWSGPGFPEKALAGKVLTQSPKEHPGLRRPKTTGFVAQYDKVKRGKELFSELNCAACHAVSPDGKLHRPEGILGPPPSLAEMPGAAGRGCLSPKPTGTAPHFGLSPMQAKAIAVALGKPVAKLKPFEVLSRTLIAFQCYACHQRDGKGGPSEERDPFFLTTQQEMGPEGRLPPRLSGVGAKLKPAWLKQVIAKGTKARPYVLTRMPAYGDALASKLTEVFLLADAGKILETPTPELSKRDALKHGRELVGNKGMACVSCHVFAGIPSQGIQGMDLTLMEKRLRPDWFRRYLLNPTSLRPGTRMPSFWSNGQSAKPKSLGGDVDKQIEAIRVYLALGSKAPVPAGLARSNMQLVVEEEARLYRNFIDGAGPRAIGVGYPGAVNLAWDANQLRPALLWHGEFMDASRHWTGRGSGFQLPDGYNVLKLPPGPSLAILADSSSPWPQQTGRAGDFRFRGYQLDAGRRPTFRYSFREVEVEDYYKEVAGGEKQDTALDRIVTFKGKIPEGLYFRAAADKAVGRHGDKGFRVGDLTVTFTWFDELVVLPRSGKGDLIVPVKPGNREFVLRQRLEW